MCDDACHYFGDCCIDRNPNEKCSSEEETLQFFAAVEHLQRSQFRCVSFYSVDQKYLAVSSCPATWIDDSVRLQCEAPPSAEFGFASIPLSYQYFVTYRNVYCALCNDVDPSELTPWDVDLLCPKEAHENFIHGISSYENLVQGNHKSCERYKMHVPSYSNGSALRPCYDNIQCPVNTCPQLSRACESVTASFPEYISFPYKNLFCYYCQHMTCLPPRPNATILPNDYYIGCYFRLWPPIRLLRPISILFDFSSDGAVKYAVEDTFVEKVTVSCSEGMVYDPFSLTCLTLSCWDGYVLQKGQCLKIVLPVNISCSSDPQIQFAVSLVLNATFSSNCVVALNELRDCLDNQLFPSATLTPIESTNTQRDICNDLLRKEAKFTMANMSATFDTITEELESLSSHSNSSIILRTECGVEKVILSEGCMQDNFSESCLSKNGSLLVYRGFYFLEILGETYIYVNSTEKLYPKSEIMIQRTFPSSVGSSSVTVCHVNELDGLACRVAVFNSSLFEPAGKSGNIRYMPTGDVIRSGEYELDRIGSIMVCEFLNRTGTGTRNQTRFLFQYSPAQVFLSYICMPLSMLALVITFGVYCILPSLKKKVCSKLIMLLCVDLFLAQLLLLVSGTALSVSEACTFVAIFSHFCWLSVFTTTTALAFDLAKTFGSHTSIHFGAEGTGTFLLYVSAALGSSLALVVICASVAFTKGEELGIRYGDEELCWLGGQVANLIAFGVPVAIVLIINSLLFVITVKGIHASKKATRGMVNRELGKQLRNNLRTFVKVMYKTGL